MQVVKPVAQLIRWWQSTNGQFVRHLVTHVEMLRYMTFECDKSKRALVVPHVRMLCCTNSCTTCSRMQSLEYRMIPKSHDPIQPQCVPKAITKRAVYTKAACPVTAGWHIKFNFFKWNERKTVCWRFTYFNFVVVIVCFMKLSSRNYIIHKLVSCKPINVVSKRHW